MAAAESRAAWQRATNRCLVQEDAKRAPKLGCCPPSVQQHETNSGSPTNPQDCHIPNFMPLNWNAMNSNLPKDTQWWLQLQPNFGCQNAFASEDLNYYMGGEVGLKKAGSFEPVSKLEDINPNKKADPFEPPWIVSTAFMKQTYETGFEELKSLPVYSEMTLNCRGSATSYLFEDKEFMDFKTFDPLYPKKPHMACYEMDAPWQENKKSRPWWQVADADGLASLVAERAIQNIDKNELPRPTQHFNAAKLNSHENKDDYQQSPPYAGKESHATQYDTTLCSYSISSTNETNSSYGGGWQQQQKNDAHEDAQDSYSSNDRTPSGKPTYRNATERAQLLDALRHSQTRAREAEMAAKKAYDEKDHVIKLLFRQASHLFACKQWLKMLQLENICLQLKFKEHQIATMFPELPWVMLKEKVPPGQERKDATRKKGRKQNKDGHLRRAVVFAVGVGIVGAGLLLGWTLGWLLPRL
ncbi:hypothetical protein GUJ93_ZPchr0009g1143 [Zizania palustris]|uniref:Uncharacterized protein n=1 Tax=Zizania palustris TaxID=103762 RepID=A0A8J5RQH7_ZIZPA|nr:hypothetical protein GUJ93_ZPchr0009g1143 [Zizania palustris]KAG8049598.1 hypothetical protein GUJ93_ZPchr0009g1143 [Zizania palustris]KAG8049599.1 hypothetical protein GUJ93_ZPchr0009g1143 [Zizania palustris]